jgi:tetratricopeptide (TPR) repeat protein
MDTERFRHAISLRDSGQVDASLRELETLGDLTADSTEKAAVVLNQGNCLAILGRSREARNRLAEAMQISSVVEVRARADFIEATLSAQEGMREEALKKMDRVLGEHGPLLATPDHRDLYQEIQVKRGFLMVELSCFSDGATVLQECLSFDLSDKDKGDVLYNLGRCYFEVGDTKRAEDKLLDTLKTGAQAGYVFSAHSMLGMIYHQEGAYAKALREFEWCLPHAREAGVPIEGVYAWLATIAGSLGLKDDAKRYAKLTKGLAGGAQQPAPTSS